MIRSAGRQKPDRAMAAVVRVGMSPAIATVPLPVADDDDAIAFYRDSLGFALVADADMGAGRGCG